MCPPRCACSWGRCAGASRRPANSSGERTSTRLSLADRGEHLVAVGPDRLVLLLGAVAGRPAGRDLGHQLAGVEFPLLPAAVEQPDVAVPVDLEVPVGVGGEPVVVAPVEDHGVIVRDAPLRQQGLEAGPADDVAPHGILQVFLPVQLHRALDVALVVGGGVLIDLGQDNPGVTEVLLDPVGVYQHVRTAHALVLLASVGEPPWRRPAIGHGRPPNFAYLSYRFNSFTSRPALPQARSSRPAQRLLLGSARMSSPRRQPSRIRPASAIVMIPAKTSAVLR